MSVMNTSSHWREFGNTGRELPPQTANCRCYCFEDRRIRRSLKDLLVTDIATAQEVFAKIGKLDRIDLILPDAPLHTTALKRIESVLPPGTRIESSDARRGAVIEMTKAFRLNLTALSLLALVVGMFLIYNTVSFSVIQRRAVIGRLRAIG